MRAFAQLPTPKNMKRNHVLSAFVAITVSASVAGAMAGQLPNPPQGPAISYGFSPEGSAFTLVMQGIASAHRSIHVLAYVLSNRQIIDALATKARDGVEVKVVVDYEENIAHDRDSYIQKQLAFLARSGAGVCSVDQFKIMHDKVMIIDGRTVQLGSFNYTKGGADANSENAMILWNSEQVAHDYEQHFESRLAMCHPL